MAESVSIWSMRTSKTDSVGRVDEQLMSSDEYTPSREVVFMSCELVNTRFSHNQMNAALETLKVDTLA